MDAATEVLLGPCSAGLGDRVEEEAEGEGLEGDKTALSFGAEVGVFGRSWAGVGADSAAAGAGVVAGAEAGAGVGVMDSAGVGVLDSAGAGVGCAGAMTDSLRAFKEAAAAGEASPGAIEPLRVLNEAAAGGAAVDPLRALREAAGARTASSETGDGLLAAAAATSSTFLLTEGWGSEVPGMEVVAGLSGCSAGMLLSPSSINVISLSLLPKSGSGL